MLISQNRHGECIMQNAKGPNEKLSDYLTHKITEMMPDATSQRITSKTPKYMSAKNYMHECQKLFHRRHAVTLPVDACIQINMLSEPSISTKQHSSTNANKLHVTKFGCISSLRLFWCMDPHGDMKRKQKYMLNQKLNCTQLIDTLSVCGGNHKTFCSRPVTTW